MKEYIHKLSFLILLILVSNQTLAQAQVCNRGLEHLPKNQYPISSLWAQEMTGTIYANELLNKQSIDKTSYSKTIIFDTGFKPSYIDLGNRDHFQQEVGDVYPDGSHGNLVASLTLGPSPIAASNYTNLFSFIHRENVLEMFKLIQNNEIAVIGSSLAEFETTLMDPLLDNLESNPFQECPEETIECYERVMGELFSTNFKNTTLVVAAGNNYPTLYIETPDYMNAISVGSISELGVPAGYSDDLDKIDIYAPAGMTVLSYDFNKYSLFSGTSAAQPLVTGTIASAKTLIKSLTTAEIKELLKFSSLQYQVGTTRTINVLNSYRFIKTVLRLKSMSFSRKSPTQRMQMIKKLALHNFQNEAAVLLENALDLSSGQTCEKLDLLRKSFLLEQSTKTRVELNQIFAQQSLDYNVLMYNNIGKENSSKMTKDFVYSLIKENSKDNYLVFTAFKYLITEFKNDYIQDFNKIFKFFKLDRKYKTSFFYELKRLKEDARREVYSMLLNFPKLVPRYFLHNKESFLTKSDYFWLLETLTPQNPEYIPTIKVFLTKLENSSGFDPRTSGMDEPAEMSIFCLKEEYILLQKISKDENIILSNQAKALLNTYKFVLIDYWDPNPFFEH